MAKKRRRRRRWNYPRLFLLIAILVAIPVIAIAASNAKKASDEKKQAEAEAIIEAERIEAENKAKRDQTIKEAEYLALTYDYDGASNLLASLPGYAEDEELQDLAASYMLTKASCVPVNVDEITHIFYHSLVVDTNAAFSDPDNRPAAIGHNQWMTTIDEFNKITQEMYDRGYVMVGIHDIIKKVKDENGVEMFVPGEILLPPGKKAFILSIDDLSYYHAYDGYGYPTKLVLDDRGKPMCEYTDAEGNTSIGAYDVVPLMDTFIEAHPDASYKGARGTIALTGYNGILGYRTDETYDYNHPSCDRHQKKWMDEHPDFNLETERAEAKKIADAMKAEGWEFASHTWGHQRAGQISMSHLETDTQRWLDNVAPLVGDTDTIIFAHGADISDNGEYNASNERFQFFKSKGFDLFFNVDSKPYTLRIYQDYVHGGRRNLDGYRIYYNVIGQQDNISDLFDAASVLDPARPPVRPLT